MWKKEPALIIGVAIAFLQALAALLASNPETMPDVAGASVWPSWTVWLLPAAGAVLQGILTRLNVFSPKTLEDAGLDPDTVVKQAEDARAEGRATP